MTNFAPEDSGKKAPSSPTIAIKILLHTIRKLVPRTCKAGEFQQPKCEKTEIT